MRVVSVFSGKGGVGKTTVSVNLGAALAQHLKKRVTLIDCNVTTSHLGLHLGMYNTHATLNDVLKEQKIMDEAVYDHPSGMKIIPASLSMSDLHGVDMTRLKDSINSILHKNDIVILDSSPGLGREAMASISASNEVLYVTSPHVPSVMDVVRCQEVAEDLGIRPLGIVMNMINRDKLEMTKEEIEHLTGLPVIATIPYDKDIRKSLAMKMPLVSYNPGSDVSRKFIDLAYNVMGEEIMAKKGFLSAFRSLKFW